MKSYGLGWKGLLRPSIVLACSDLQAYIFIFMYFKYLVSCI